MYATAPHPIANVVRGAAYEFGYRPSRARCANHVCVFRATYRGRRVTARIEYHGVRVSALPCDPVLYEDMSGYVRIGRRWFLLRPRTW